MDFVEDPKTLLRTMEVNQIGKKKSLFYQAYALYYEKIKKFEEAEKMYHLGVQKYVLYNLKLVLFGCLKCLQEMEFFHICSYG